MSSTVQCPNCKQPVTADSEFCIFCGTKLPAIPRTPKFSSSASGGYAKAMMKCKNGHEFDDASLLYCPICGLPFEGAPDYYVPSGESWRCTCGYVNQADNAFCEGCSRPKEPKPSGRIRAPETKSSTTYIPEGMYTPTDDDLMPKKRLNKR